MSINPKTLVDVYLDGAAQSHKSAMRVIARLRATLAERDAENAALKAEREWRPIESAPFDTWVYLYRVGSKWLRCGIRSRLYGSSRWFYGTAHEAAHYGQSGDDAPTHWQPLPPAPEAT